MTHAPALQAAAGAMAASNQTDRCPKCGGELVFHSDRLGYGQTVEHCLNWKQCGHWRTLETIVRTARAPAPRGPERRSLKEPENVPQAGKRPYQRQSAAGELQAAILRVLPTSPATARSAKDLAERAGKDPRSVMTRLGQLALDGTIRRVKDGRRARFWRAA